MPESRRGNCCGSSFEFETLFARAAAAADVFPPRPEADADAWLESRGESRDEGLEVVQGRILEERRRRGRDGARDGSLRPEEARERLDRATESSASGLRDLPGPRGEGVRVVQRKRVLCSGGQDAVPSALSEHILPHLPRTWKCPLPRLPGYWVPCSVAGERPGEEEVRFQRGHGWLWRLSAPRPWVVEKKW